MTVPAEVPDDRPRRRLSIRTLVLAVAAIGAWLAYLSQRVAIPELRSRVAALSLLDSGLIVDDPSRIAVVRRMDLWWGDQRRWDVHLPAGAYRLCLATRGIGAEGLAPVAASVPLESGRRAIRLDFRTGIDTGVVTVAADGAARVGPLTIRVDQVAPYSVSEASQPGLCERHAPDGPVVLQRIVFGRGGGRPAGALPTGPGEGILLWIEPAS